MAAQRGADFFLDNAPVADLFEVGFLDGFQNDFAGAFDQLGRLGERDESPRDDFRLRFELSGVLVDGEDGDDDAILGDMAALFQNFLFHFVQRADVNINFPHFYSTGLSSALLVELQHVAAFQDEDFAGDGRQFLGNRGVAVELAVVAVNRDEVPRADQVQHQLQFFNAPVPRYVDGRNASVVIMDAGPSPVKVVNDAENGLLIARYDPRGKHHFVVRLDRDPAMTLDRHSGQRRHGLALAARQENRDLVARKLAHVLGLNQQALGHVQAAHLERRSRDLQHAAADEREAAAELLGEIGHQL